MSEPRPQIVIDDRVWHFDGSTVRLRKVLKVNPLVIDGNHLCDFLTLPHRCFKGETEKVHRDNCYKFPDEREKLIESIEAAIQCLRGDLREALEGEGDEEHVNQMLKYYGGEK